MAKEKNKANPKPKKPKRPKKPKVSVNATSVLVNNDKVSEVEENVLDFSETGFRDTNMILHFMTLSLAVLTFAVGFGAVISTIQCVYTDLLQLNDVLAIPSIFGLIGIGFLLGSLIWGKRKQVAFSKSAMFLALMIILNLALFMVPVLFRTLTVTAINSLNIDGETIYTFPAISSVFIFLYSILGGLIISMLVPALSLVDIWYRERLRRKKLFIAPPMVRKYLALWAPFVIFVMILGYMISRLFLRGTEIESFADARTGLIVSTIFLLISFVACIVYSLYRPKKSEIYADEHYDVTTVGYKLFGWRSRFLAYLSAMIGIAGLTAFFIIYFTQYGFILHFAQPDSQGIPFGFFIVFLVGFAVGLALLKFKISINVQIYIGLLFLILAYYASTMAFDRIHQPNHEVFESTITFSMLAFGLLGFLFAVFIRSARAFFEAEVYKEGRYLSQALGFGLLLGSVVSAFLIAGVDSPFVLMNYGFNFFAGCVILAVIIAPTGIWKARNEIMNLGATYFEKDKTSLKSLMISLLWGIGLSAIVVFWNYSYKETLQLEGYKFVQNTAVRTISDNDDSMTLEINGSKTVFDKTFEDYSTVSGLLGMLAQPQSDAAFLTNNLQLLSKSEDAGFNKTLLVNPNSVAVNNPAEHVLNPYLWTLTCETEKLYIHIDVNDETAKFLLENGLMGALQQLADPYHMISFNLNLKKLTPHNFADAINSILQNFKDFKAYYLPDMLILLNKKPEFAADTKLENFDLGNLQFPSDPANMLKELTFWEIKPKTVNTISGYDGKNAYKIINTIILEGFCEEDSLPHTVLQTLNLLDENKLDDAKSTALDARNKHKELAFHEESLQKETRFPVRAVYNNVQYEEFYQKAEDAMNEADKADNATIRKNRLNDAMIWGQKAADLKPWDLTAWILCYKAAKMLDARDLPLFEKKIGELNQKTLEILQQEDFANK